MPHTVEASKQRHFSFSPFLGHIQDQGVLDVGVNVQFGGFFLLGVTELFVNLNAESYLPLRKKGNIRI